MREWDRVFLTPEEALGAVRADIAGYAPQPGLYARMLSLMPGVVVDGEVDRHAILGRLDALPLDCGFLARLCALVFDTACEPGCGVDGGEGVWVCTGMEDFACTRCGHCCLALDFHRECVADDVALWRELGRTDILAWVGEEPGPGGETLYRIWQNPQTGLYAEACPWLRRIPGDRAFVCAIQDVKPDICRSYPGLRKHGLMTGCRGFGRS